MTTELTAWDTMDKDELEARVGQYYYAIFDSYPTEKSFFKYRDRLIDTAKQLDAYVTKKLSTPGGRAILEENGWIL